MQNVKILAATLAFVTLSTLAIAHGENVHSEKGHSKAIDYRNSVMTVMKWNIRPMGKMVKGEMPYDKDAFAQHAADLKNTSHLNLLAGFPEGSDEGEDTSARIDIWMDWDGFVEKYDALKKASSELAETAAGGDLDAIKPKFGAVGKACKSCHDDFKDK